ncbi:unnamed protein product [Cuscuta campestris]|uniref:Association with the SNF1 complex (ASC) domain-containing protein n=2 Tax=Cuscuta sect. Cleistogrammica TaxID=1824901 RepID=A0A484KD34_9ASTE|nr:hypothetical protein DM860_006225 [Cuscuta australis]VFQ63821.1 unnamed protein product [Cuscuta campestris]
MSTQQDGNEYEPTVPGFEAPPSPESSYNNVFYFTEDEEKKGPPRLPPYLKRSALNKARGEVGEGSSQSAPLPVPNPVVLNHMHCTAESRASSSEPVALATTQRFRSKYVTVVLYKPASQR